MSRKHRANYRLDLIFYLLGRINNLAVDTEIVDWKCLQTTRYEKIWTIKGTELWGDF